MRKNNTFDRLTIEMNPEYLIEISNSFEMLNHFYEQEGLGSISKEYRNVLVASFNSLNQKLQIYGSQQNNDASCMIQGSIIRCRSDLEIFCLNKVGDLLSKETPDIANMVKMIASMYQSNVDEFERVLQGERRKRAEAIENEKDKIIMKLKEELLYRKQYIKEIKDRLDQVEAENSKLYQRLINKAKNVSQRSRSPSPSKLIQTSNQSMLKIKSDLIQKSARKPPTSKQLEQTVHDIMETKLKQQNVKGKRVNLQSYLKTYFRNKFGVKNMADYMEIVFRESLEEFAHSEEKSIFILFQKMMEQQCEEQYFWDHQTFQQKVIRIIKRYLNEKQGWPIDQLDKFYDGKISSQLSEFMLNDKDVQYILINLYKTTEIQSLQMIFIQNLLPKLRQQQIQQQFLMPSQKLINQILNYELNRHLLRIQDILRIIHEIDSGNGLFTFDEFQSLMVRLNISNDKIAVNQPLLTSLQDKYLTVSEVVEGIEKLRKTKPKKR